MKIDIEEEYDKIYRYCYFKLRDKYLAEDITQETILRFLESDSYRDTGQGLAYLYTVARNLCIDTYRKKQPQLMGEPWLLERTAYGSEAKYENGQNMVYGSGQEAVYEGVCEGFEEETVDRLLLKEALSSLTETEKELVVLRYVNEIPLAVLGNMYGKSRFALYRELNKIMKKLERRISDGTQN